jgi:hypothetical protein
VRVKSGLEYRLAEPLHLRLGVASNPVSYSFGIGIELPGNIKIDIASNYHQLLGFTPAFTLMYQRSTAGN